MGFCLFNNAAIAANEIAKQGKKVLIFDFDVHHGNGTQDIFYDSSRPATGIIFNLQGFLFERVIIRVLGQQQRPEVGMPRNLMPKKGPDTFPSILLQTQLNGCKSTFLVTSSRSSPDLAW
jgi:hypothetical protein